jgi:hypothetical protein
MIQAVIRETMGQADRYKFADESFSGEYSGHSRDGKLGPNKRKSPSCTRIIHCLNYVIFGNVRRPDVVDKIATAEVRQYEWRAHNQLSCQNYECQSHRRVIHYNHSPQHIHARLSKTEIMSCNTCRRPNLYYSGKIYIMHGKL